jgi:hypothetical protein
MLVMAFRAVNSHFARPARGEIFPAIPHRVRIRYLQFDYDRPAQLNGAQIAVLDFKIGAVNT